MALSIKPKFTKAQLKEILDKRKANLGQAILFRLQKIGETFVTNARNNGNYKDHTGNLRSSIGYVILKDGVQLFDNFKSFPAGDPTAKGVAVGSENAQNLIGDIAVAFPRGFVLIVVAGMEYAASVESKHFDVLTSSSLVAANDLKEAIDTLTSKVSTL